MPAATYERARELLQSRLTPTALRHSVATGDQAARLADAYGVDPDTARIAGLLHDWSREAGDEELAQRAFENGSAITEIDRTVPYLLHGGVGASEVREAFPELPDEVIDAIARHTMGARVMTPLDMVVYLADVLEPGRSFDGLDELRSAVGAVPLKELYAQAYAASIRHLVARRKFIHPSTVEAWNAIVAGDPQ